MKEIKEILQNFKKKKKKKFGSWETSKYRTKIKRGCHKSERQISGAESEASPAWPD